MSQSAPSSFPTAQQAQIIRANQRDLIHVSSFKNQTDNVLRSWLGSRWLTRWDKEVDLLVNLAYYGLTTGRATQTLGEEYTDIWQHSAFTERAPTARARAALILLSTLPSYIIARFGSRLDSLPHKLSSMLRALPIYIEVATDLNLSIFYLKGSYHDLIKRVLGIRHLSSIPENPHVRPPSYSLLGVLILVRLCYRLLTYIRSARAQPQTKGKTQASYRDNELYIDDQPVSSLLEFIDPEAEPARPAEEDERTMLDIRAIPAELRASRNCTLCLEERTDSCATECGHLFCWSCIVGWGREKPECPLCRQSLNLTRLLPIYNL
ncbi:peroxisome bioproteinsis factor 10 [Pleurotus ostreatus]|uniref:RING-type E3 ubiquitin transferase n=1 Tax=Pleurotus ostreatus TaxID=5322 RepID=A0A8H7DX26_PLEOS|nr:peroxisome biogenesis factor 10 [Pleurotus ostreatus]KAF7437243.1 peroxisome bioproteinsis factor 10 [Pleurotus ostreatus]KAJ8703130.1 peroxisome biogenesis factor 10 [Pleurotus ostreatus]